MDPGRACLEENGFFMTESSVDNSHSELAIEVWERADASNEEIDVFSHGIISEKAINSDDLDFVTDIFSNLCQELLSVVCWEDRSEKWNKYKLNQHQNNWKEKMLTSWQN